MSKVSLAPLSLGTLLAALSLLGCPTGDSTLFEVGVETDTVYGLGYVSTDAAEGALALKELLLDVYLPLDGSGQTRPAVILVHGGSFTEGSKEKEQIVDYARYFARHGMVAFAVNYRLRDDRPPASGAWNATPLTAAAHAAMVDVKAAVRFVRANAEAYAVDPGRIALLGESSGAIAGAAAAMSDRPEFAQDRPDLPILETNYPETSSRIQAYVHFWGNADHVLLDIDRNDPPVLIVHGTDDDEPGASFEASERFDRFLGLWGVPHEFYKARGLDHGAWEYREGLKNLKVLTLEFLQTHLAP